jgi:hypothetical protein
MKTFALLLILLMASPALSQTVHTSSLDPGTSTDFQRSYRGEEEGDGTTRALKRHLRRELVDVGLRGTYRRMRHLGSGVARLLGIDDDPEGNVIRTGRRVACRWEADPFDLSLGLDVVHRHGMTTNIEVDLDDRRVALEVEGRQRINYGIAYEDDRNTVQAMVTLPF